MGLVLLLSWVPSASAAIIFIPMFIPPPSVPGAQTSDYQNIHTVALISALGQHLTMRNNHFIGPREHRLDIRDWSLDDAIASWLKQYLSPRFAFREIPYDRTVLAAVPNGKWDGLSSKFSAFMKTLPTEGIDAFVVVRPDLGTEAPGTEGLGLENGGAFGDMTPVLWANYEIDVIDARTQKTIACAYSRVSLRDKTPESFVGLRVSERLRVGDDFILKDEQAKLLRQDIAFVLRLSIIETLRSLNLGISLPNPGARVLAPIPADQNPYRAYKSVAVVSGIGDVIDLEHLGDTILSHDSYKIAEPDWQLDAMLENRAQSVLRHRFTIKNAVVDRAAFANARVRDGDGKYAPDFPGLSPSPDIDLYVALVKIHDHVMPTVAQVNGIGVFNKSAIGAITRAVGNYAAVVLDAHTLNVLLVRRALPSPSQPSDVPMEVLDDSVWPSAPPAMTADQAAKIRTTLTDLLTDSEDELLLSTGLSGQMVSDDLPGSGAEPRVQ
jgi:hypothetical protein